MGLGSVSQTALSGLAAAESSVAVVANNLANLRTDGFKQSRARFTTQTPQTRSGGIAPSGAGGGFNPVQLGTGVRLGEVSTDFSQGPIVPDASPTSLALEGDGLFILEGPRGEQTFTRDGRFRLNALGELVTANGHRLLGFGVNQKFSLQTDRLQPLRISPSAVARAADGTLSRLQGFFVTGEGRLRGRFDDGVLRDLGQIRLARFANQRGLTQHSSGSFRSGPNSGLAVQTNPGERGSATVRQSAVEGSNVDVGESLVELSLASTQFRANLAVLNVADELLDTLAGLPRMS